MRLAAQMRGGFYPAPSEAIAMATTFLQPPNGPFTILDPCAGEGAALSQLCISLGCPSSSAFAIELDDSRAQTLKTHLPEAQILAPASFCGCRASFNAFSFIWLNPPFDDSLEGNRVEERFLLMATDWLKPGGILALVCPEDVAEEGSFVRRHLALYYQNCLIVPFPEEKRRYGEVIVFGQKRFKPWKDATSPPSWQMVQAPQGLVYPIPTGSAPKTFKKVEPTETELQRMLAQSPLRIHLETPSPEPLPSPPLALGIGHIALLLASGQLDGVVYPENQLPHVVRGSSRKSEYVADVNETDNPDGSTTTRTTLSQRIELVVRTVDLSGTIQTFLETDAPQENPKPP